MVKCFIAAVFVALFALPALAQDEDFPRIEIGMGYGRINLDNIANLGLTEGGWHSGFVSQQGFNFTHWLGVENYLGYYGAGSGANFFTNVFGVKVAARQLKRVVPYGSAGFGGSSLMLSGLGSESAMATRIGGGIDIPFNDSMAVRLDYSRVSSHLFGEWNSSKHFSTGIVITLGQ
jgi:outer membrane protein with beta-barrel domain